MLADMVNGMSMLVDMLSWMLIHSINVNAIFNGNLCFDMLLLNFGVTTSINAL